MNSVDAMVFALLVLADLALFFHLRRARCRRTRARRMMHCLALAVQRENAAHPFAAAARQWPLERAG